MTTDLCLLVSGTLMTPGAAVPYSERAIVKRVLLANKHTHTHTHAVVTVCLCQIVASVVTLRTGPLRCVSLSLAFSASMQEASSR